MAVNRHYSILLVDNSPEQLAALEQALRCHPLSSSLVFATATSAGKCESLFSFRGAESFDIIMMDIDLGEGDPSGIELIKKHLPSDSATQVIYLTGHLQLVPEVFDTPHTFILAKPITKQSVDRALRRTIDQLNRQVRSSGYLAVSSNGGIRKIPCTDILWLESDQHKVQIYTNAGPIETPGPMASIEEHLPDSFFRIHRKYVVNFEHVDFFGDQVQMDNGITLTVSRACKSEARDAFFSYIEGSR